MAKLFGRKYELLYRTKVDGEDVVIDFSEFKFTFKTIARTAGDLNPAGCTFRIFNLSKDTFIKMQNGGEIVLGAGYEEQFGQIFKGYVTFLNKGKDGVTSYIEVEANDGYKIHTDGFVSESVVRGTGVNSRLFNIINSSTVKPAEIKSDSIKDDRKTIRGSVHFGSLKQQLRTYCSAEGAEWHIQDDGINIVKVGDYTGDKENIVELNYETGMIGQATTTAEGVIVKCLLNPFIKAGNKIKINADTLQAQQIDSRNAADTSKYTATEVNIDGEYKVLQVTHEGDTRGPEWYTLLICNSADRPYTDNVEQSRVMEVETIKQ